MSLKSVQTAVSMQALHKFHAKASDLKQFIEPSELLCRQPESSMQAGANRATHELDSAIFLLALLMIITISHEHVPDEDCSPFIWAFKYLTAPFAWGKSTSRAIREYDQSKAGVGLST